VIPEPAATEGASLLVQLFGRIINAVGLDLLANGNTHRAFGGSACAAIIGVDRLGLMGLLVLVLVLAAANDTYCFAEPEPRHNDECTGWKILGRQQGRRQGRQRTNRVIWDTV
jgi:hypothetical protein